MKNSGIYEILNTANGKRYIGSAGNFSRRWAAHRRSLSGGTHHSVPLQRSWDKHGAGAFQFGVVMLCSTDNLLAWEQQYIDEFAPEYNVCPVAGSSRGAKLSAEARARMSIAAKKRAQLPSVRVNLFVAGVKTGPQSPEHIEKRAGPRRGVPRVFSPSWKAALAAGRARAVATRAAKKMGGVL